MKLCSLFYYSAAILAISLPLYGAEDDADDNPEEQVKKPNILVIMGDDVGWFNIGAYHRGIMSGKTPNLDKLAKRRDAIYRLLRRGQLHSRPRELHHRRTSHTHRIDHCWPGWSGRWPSGSSMHNCHRT